MLPAHLFMNFRVVDEHGRQLGMGRNLAALKAELGAQARSAFQALAGLKAAGAVAERGRGAAGAARAAAERRVARRAPERQQRRGAAAPPADAPALHRLDLRRAARADGGRARAARRWSAFRR